VAWAIPRWPATVAKEGESPEVIDPEATTWRLAHRRADLTVLRSRRCHLRSARVQTTPETAVSDPDHLPLAGSETIGGENALDDG